MIAKQPSPLDPRQRQPAAAEQTLRQAIFALQSGRLDEAQWLAAEVLRGQPNDPRAQHISGYALLLQGRAKDAIAPLQEAARRSHDPAVETQLAMALRQAGREEDALERLKRATKRRPPFPPAYLELGNLLAALGRNDEAVDVLRRGQALAPHMGELSIQLGFIFLARNDPANARAMLERGLADAPHDVDAMFALARIVQNDDGDFARAAELYRRLLAVTPDDAAARIGLGVCLIELGQAEAGIDNLRAASRAGAKMYGEALTALVSTGRGRFWLNASDAARVLREEKA